MWVITRGRGNGKGGGIYGVITRGRGNGKETRHIAWPVCGVATIGGMVGGVITRGRGRGNGKEGYIDCQGRGGTY